MGVGCRMGCQSHPGLTMGETQPCEEHSVTGRGQQTCDVGGVVIIALEGPMREGEERDRAGHHQGR